MSDLFLIAHKVRGEAAFDVACMLDVLDEDGDPIWIIPTSGHRARPYWLTELKGLCEQPMYDVIASSILFDVPPMPADLLDHYHLSAPAQANRTSLIDRLNLNRPTAPPIIRRI